MRNISDLHKFPLFYFDEALGSLSNAKFDILSERNYFPRAQASPWIETILSR